MKIYTILNQFRKNKCCAKTNLTDLDLRTRLTVP